jgi:cobalt-zinc-cadmium efflux system protein
VTHRHDHHAHRAEDRRRLVVVLALTTAVLVAEAVGGWLTNSLALLSDAAHMLTDVAALVLGLVAIWFTTRPATPRNTYGFYRVEILAALANAVTLIVISAVIFYEAYHRLLQPPEVKSLAMMIIAMVGLAANLAGVLILARAHLENLNVRGVLIHVIGDTLGSLGAIGAAVVMLTTGWYYADPIISAGIGLLILYSAWRLMSDSVAVLLQGTPAGLDVAAVMAKMREVEGVQNVCDVHVWSLTSGVTIMTGHVVICCWDDAQRILLDVRHLLEDTFKIDHCTIEVDTSETATAECPL